MGNQTDKITQLQIYMLFTLYLFTTILGFRMSTLVAEARFSAWVSLLCGSLIGLIITYLCFRLAVKRPQEFFGFYGKRIVGSWLHYPLVLIIIFSTLFSASYILREIQDFIVEVYLPEHLNGPLLSYLASASPMRSARAFRRYSAAPKASFFSVFSA